MNEDCLKLTTYFGERDRVGDQFLADALTDIYARYELQTSLVMRGIEGFGVKHHLRTDRLLTLSEDLPLVSVAVDTRAQVEAVADDVRKLRFDGLVTLERARMLTGQIESVHLPLDSPDATKLTVYVGRHERANGRPAHEAVVDLLHRVGVTGATVLLGVDGTAHGVRRRARFFASNTGVPLMVLGIGEASQIGALLPELDAMLARPLITLERVQVCKRDGRLLAEPPHLPAADTSGMGIWQKLMVYSHEHDRGPSHPLHHELIRALRPAGAAGATSLRGIWGYGGQHRPHGDSLWQLRRRVPIVTVIVDTPERVRRWFTVLDQLTTHAGLVTSEIVPAFRATGPGIARGGLGLSSPGGLQG